MDRPLLLREIERRLGDRRLVWFGTRGDDAEAVTDVPQFDAAFSLISRLRSRPSIGGLSLEELTGRRPDLDTFDIDDHLRSPEVADLRVTILRALARRSALFTYRPTTFLSAIGFSRQDRCRYLGLFRGHQAAFEHKPWLETSIAGLDIPHVPWRYVPDIELLDTRELLRDGPVMLRRSRTTGGVGLVRVDDPAEVEAMWPDEEEAYVSVAPFLGDAIPVNVGAVVWRDGVTVHPASVQLIGITGCTTRPFGYCGNDFGAALDLGSGVLEQIDTACRRIGEWLGTFGYLGAFGVDFLVQDGAALFTEVNPRFQGSTHASCRLSVEWNQSCLLLEHLAAYLGLDAPDDRPVGAQAADVGTFAHLVVHHTGETPTTIDPSRLLAAAAEPATLQRADVVTDPSLLTEPGGTIARLTVRDRLTDDGFSLSRPWRRAVAGDRPD